jgi:hypothetical protein
MNNQNILKMAIGLTSNYNTFIKNDIFEIKNSFVSSIEEYLIYSFNKIDLTNNNLKHIINGLNTIIHVFIVLFYYTKNLELTCYHVKQSYMYYMDFIEQKNGENSFQNLTYIDAITFVYRKTIYEINNIYKLSLNTSISDKRVFSQLECHKDVYNNMLVFIMEQSDFHLNKTTYLMQWSFTMKKINELNLNEDEINNIHLFIILLKTHNIILSVDDQFKYIIIFCERFKLTKNKLVFENKLINDLKYNNVNEIIEDLFR